MTPLQLIVKYLPNYWQSHYGLRRKCNDPQILGYEYCAEGAICDIFLKYAPQAFDLMARWEHRYFCWNDTDGFGFPIRLKEGRFMPSPVVKWINRHHGEGAGEKLQTSLAYLNDSTSRYTLQQIADVIAIQFSVKDVLANAKQKGSRFFASTLKEQPIL